MKRALAERAAGRPRTRSNVGTLRRVHALRALGWPSRHLAQLIGVNERNICRWEHRTIVSRRIYERVCEVYDALSMTPGPDTRARRHAQRRGWVPPLAWDDDTIDSPQARPIIGQAARPLTGQMVLLPDWRREVNRTSKRRGRGVARPVGRCDECGGSFCLTAAGSLYAHRDGSGRCDGSGRIALTVVAVAS